MSYENLSVKELEAKISDITAQQAALKQEKLAIHAVLDRKAAAAAAQAKLERMSDAEKVAMAQTLQAQGINGAEAFGKI